MMKLLLFALAVSGQLIEVPLTTMLVRSRPRMEITTGNQTDEKLVKNYQYVGTFYIGKDKQAKNMLLDTGTSWLWLKGSDCPDS